MQGTTPQYDLSIRILPGVHRLEGAGSVLIAAADRRRETVELKLSEQMVDFFVEVLEPAESMGAARLEKGAAKGGSLMWKVWPSQPFPPSKPVRLRLSWSGGEQTAFVFHIGPEVSFASGLNTAWYPQVDGGSGAGRLRISVPTGYTAHAVGLNRGTSEEAARGLFLFEVTWPTYFGFVAGKYTVVRKDGLVPMSAYLLRPRQNIDRYIDGCSRILKVLVQEFGPYPFGEFAIVEVPDEQAAKAGFSGASVDGFIMADTSSIDEDFNLAYYGHEIGHQWWGNLIKRKGARGNYMLDEALAQYGSLRAVEILDGAFAAEQYRRKGYPGYIATQNGFGYLLRAAAGVDHRLADLPPGGDSHLLSDSKGFFVWDMLSRTIGREKFRLILQRFTRQHAFQNVTWEELLRAIHDGAGRDLHWFYTQWFERTGAPEWHLTWKQAGQSVRIIITQPQPYYEADAEVRMEAGGQHFVRTVKLKGARTEFTWTTKQQVESVVLDPNFLILRWTPEYRAEATALAPHTRASRTLSEGKYAQAHEEFKTALGKVPSPDLYGLRFMLEYGRGMVFYNEKKWADARSHLMAALASPSRRADQLPRLYFRLAQINKELRDEDALRWAVDSTITADALDAAKSGMAGRALQILRSTQRADESQTVFKGTLLGHDGQPVSKSHVHLSRFGSAKPLASVEAGKDGSFSLPTDERGLFRLLFTGVDHQAEEVTLLVDRPGEIGINVKLQRYDYLNDFSNVQIIGDFNDFSFNNARPMAKQGDGTFVAEFDTAAERFAYQLLGVRKGGGSINGTQSADYVYDGGGDYRSLIMPKNGRVKIIFDPKLLLRSNTRAQVRFTKADSTPARFASIYEAMLHRRKPLRSALAAHEKTGKPLYEFSYDWSADLADLAKQIAGEKEPLLRQALLLSYLDTGLGVYGAKLERELAKRALAEIDPISPLWSIEPYLIGVAVANTGQAENYTAYVNQVINNHPDASVKRITKATLAPDRNIRAGKMVPAFSLISLDDSKTVYTGENLRGKILLLDFWATWCVPCIEEMPNLHQAYEKFKGRGFEILSVSLDERQEAVKELRKGKWKMPWLHTLLSSDSEVKKQFEIVGIPKAVLIDQSGRIVATDRDLRGRNLNQTLARLLSAPK